LAFFQVLEQAEVNWEWSSSNDDTSFWLNIDFVQRGRAASESPAYKTKWSCRGSVSLFSNLSAMGSCCDEGFKRIWLDIDHPATLFIRLIGLLIYCDVILRMHRKQTFAE
jgi:hypothetical protein